MWAKFQIPNPTGAHAKSVVWSLTAGQVKVNRASIMFDDRIEIAVGRSLKQNGMSFSSLQLSKSGRTNA
jgi:hypothetical protein